MESTIAINIQASNQQLYEKLNTPQVVTKEFFKIYNTVILNNTVSRIFWTSALAI